MPVDKKDPWTILGIPRTATEEEIKAQYRKLALSLHPDKHSAGLTPEQKKEREERFKDVSVAYQVAMDIAKLRGSSAGSQDPNHPLYEDYEKWRGMWERVEEMIRTQDLVSVLKDAVKGTLHDMARVAVKRMSKAANGAERTESDDEDASDISSSVDTNSNREDDEHTIPEEEHVFKLTVSLNEVHRRKNRKVRLFLQNYPKDPVMVEVDFDTFPEMVHYHVVHGTKHRIVIQMVPKKHPVYYWDPLLGGYDLYTTVPISLYEYLTGAIKIIPRLGEDVEEPLMLEVPAFIGLKSPIVYENMGLRGKGALYVMVEVILPMRNNWEILREEEPEALEDFLCVCKKLENPNAPHRGSS